MSDTIAGRALDELEAAEWARRRPYGSRVAMALNDFVRAWGSGHMLAWLIAFEPGSDAQDGALRLYDKLYGDELVNSTKSEDIAAAALVMLLREASRPQRRRLATSLAHMPWGAAGMTVGGVR